MATDVVMPQMGESIAEGTIVRWIKKVGDSVERDEPLFENSTDKVDAEIPSPVAGVIAEIRAQEGETVPVNSVVAVIAPAGTKAVAISKEETPGLKTGPATEARPAVPASVEPTPPAPVAGPDGSTSGVGPAGPTSGVSPADPTSGVGPTGAIQGPAPTGPTTAVRPTGTSRELAPGPDEQSSEDVVRERSSPLVRRIAKEHNIDIAQIRGTGISGRVTKDDILAFISASPAAMAQVGAGRSTPAPEASFPRPATPTTGGASRAHPTPGTVVLMSPMRKKIAEHMISSRRTSAHVHSVFEVNFSRVAQIREAKKAAYERGGGNLTYLSFILKAVVDALRAVPVVNASVEGETIVYHKDVNVGIAVALDWGLIVPVIKNADDKDLLSLSRSVSDLAARARSKQLKPEEVTGGTFTITNPGVFGALVGMPIINQPQVAILGIGNVEKRAIVIDDAIAIRPMAYLSIGYDHRVIDGAVADEFMSHIKHSLENWDPATV